MASEGRCEALAAEGKAVELVGADKAWLWGPPSCPFLTMCIVSIPAISLRAQLMSLKPSMGRTMRLIVPMILLDEVFKYLD